MRSIQISLDGDTQEAYARQRPGGSLARRTPPAARRARPACRSKSPSPPPDYNIHEAEAVIEQARALGAFRFNTGRLMRVGTAARLWEACSRARRNIAHFRQHARAPIRRRVGGPMEFCYSPFSHRGRVARSLADPPATMLVLPDGWVKVAAPLPYICADVAA